MLKSKLVLAMVCVSFVALTTTGCLPGQKKEAPVVEPQVEQQAAPVVEEEQAPAEEATTEETTTEEATTEETTTEEAPAQ